MCTHARWAFLYLLQAPAPSRGDKMIIFLSNNEQFLDGFWAAVCGGIVPVPLAVGISDEHRHKLLRVARKLGNPLLYTDAKSLERLGDLAAAGGRVAAVPATQSARLPGRIDHGYLQDRQIAPARNLRIWPSSNSPPDRPANPKA